MLYFYSIFISIMGCYAYFKVGSMICLTSSLACGVIVGVAALYKPFQWLAYGIASLLTFSFTLNLISSPRFFPNGILALVSVCVIAWPFVRKLRISFGDLPHSSRRTQR